MYGSVCFKSVYECDCFVCVCVQQFVCVSVRVCCHPCIHSSLLYMRECIICVCVRERVKLNYNKLSNGKDSENKSLCVPVCVSKVCMRLCDRFVRACVSIQSFQRVMYERVRYV